MRLPLRTIAICLAAAFLSVHGAFASPYDDGLSFKALTKRDGLPQISVMAIARDSGGYMWFGTRGGLCRFDGAECVVYDEAGSGLPDNYVSKLLALSDGRLIVGTINGLCSVDVNTGEISPYRILGGGIRSLIEDRDGNVWGNNAKYLFRIDAAADTVSVTGISRIPCCLAEAPDTTMLLAGTSEGLFLLSGSDGSMSPVPSFPEGLNIQALLRDRRSGIWVGTRSDGLFLLDRDLKVAEHYTSPALNSDYVRALAEDRDGNIVVATYDGINVLRRSQGDIRSYRLGSSFPQNDALSFFSAISLCCCADGTLWAGSYVGGLNYANPFRESFLTLENPGAKIGGTIGNVGPVACGEGGLWVGMEGDGLLFRSASGRFEKVPVRGIPQGYRANIVSSICRNAGTVFVGFNDGTAASIDEATRRTTSVRVVSKDNIVIAIARDVDGTQYFGTWGDTESGDLHVLEKGGTLRSGFRDTATGKLLFRHITSIIPAGDGSVWIGERDGGIVKFDFRSGAYAQSNLVLPGAKYTSSNVNAMILASDGSLYAATHRSGLMRVSPSLEITGTWSVGEGLPSKTVNSVVEDGDGRIWVTTSDAVCCVNPKTGETWTWPLPYDGEFNRRSAAFCAGEIFSGAGKNIVRFRPGIAVAESSAPAPRIVSVAADARPLSPGSLSGDARFGSLTHLSVYFRSLEYTPGTEITYAYRVDGLDSQWVGLGNNPKVNMANFPAGEYVFRTKAFSGMNDKTGTEGESFTFRVLAPLWRRWWMLCLYALFAGLAAFGVLSWKKAKSGLDDEREELRRICERMTLSSPEAAGSSPEAEFMKKVYSCINAHIDEPGLGVDLICAEAGASRTGLYYKIKKITGLSPMDFVRKVRLDVACRLLSDGPASVSDVAEKVGFASASYFSTAFKSAFGVSPSEYMNQHKPQTKTSNNKSK